MFAFGMGAALPLLALGLFSREAVMRWRNQLLSTGHGVKVALGLLFVAIGALVLSGFDKTIETALVDASPQWLTDLRAILDQVRKDWGHRSKSTSKIMALGS